MEATERTWRGVSAEDRRAERRSRLLEAALDVIGSEGVEAVTMKAVRIRAGLTERYFYESFANRDELLGVLYSELIAEASEAGLAAITAAPDELQARLRAVAEVVVAILIEDPRKARALVEASGTQPARLPREQAVRTWAELWAQQMAELRGLREHRKESRLTLGALLLLGGFADGIAAWLDGTIKLSREELVEHLASLGVAVADAVA